jgi:hypothetical protein
MIVKDALIAILNDQATSRLRYACYKWYEKGRYGILRR